MEKSTTAIEPNAPMDHTSQIMERAEICRDGNTTDAVGTSADNEASRSWVATDGMAADRGNSRSVAATDLLSAISSPTGFLRSTSGEVMSDGQAFVAAEIGAKGTVQLGTINDSPGTIKAATIPTLHTK